MRNLDALSQMLMFGVSAIVVISLFKLAMGIYPVPGLSDLAAFI
jgi:hypothetical protein